METLYFSRLRPGAVLPSKRREDAGYDIYLCLEEDPVCLEPHETRALPRASPAPAIRAIIFRSRSGVPLAPGGSASGAGSSIAGTGGMVYPCDQS